MRKMDPASVAYRRTYDVWRQMNRRCSNPAAIDYRYYGGRGIRVCERWHSFGQFLADMGIKPDGYSIDRRNPDGNYEPANCSWIPWKDQLKTTRNAVRVVEVTPRVVELRRAGMVQDEIASTLRISQSSVSRVLAVHSFPRRRRAIFTRSEQ